MHACVHCVLSRVYASTRVVIGARTHVLAFMHALACGVAFCSPSAQSTPSPHSDGLAPPSSPASLLRCSRPGVISTEGRARAAFLEPDPWVLFPGPPRESSPLLMFSSESRSALPLPSTPATAAQAPLRCPSGSLMEQLRGRLVLGAERALTREQNRQSAPKREEALLGQRAPNTSGGRCLWRRKKQHAAIWGERCRHELLPETPRRPFTEGHEAGSAAPRARPRAQNSDEPDRAGAGAGAVGGAARPSKRRDHQLLEFKNFFGKLGILGGNGS